MKNILYLDDYINLYSEKLDKTIIEKPYKHTLSNGRIINTEKFIKYFKIIKEKHKINNNIFSENIIVIINLKILEDDKTKLKRILEELNYKNIRIINELEILKINKKKLFINYNYSYFYMYYMDSNKVKINMYENNFINRQLLLEAIKLTNKNEILVTGKNSEELDNILKTSKYNYYYYEDYDNLFIKMYNLMSSNKKIK